MMYNGRLARLFAVSNKLQSLLASTSIRQSRSNHLLIKDEVKDALATGRPVVALESTILTHGMPFPDNLRMARSVEEIIRKEGAVPATIALISGKAYIGLNEGELTLVSDTSNNKAVKVSRRDVAYALNQGLLGGTTISGTMLLAHKAGIKMFVSGGLGGVHRGGEVTMDISADLTELARTPVALVTSGVKSILDIGRTMEYLETLGVCVASYGLSTEFPAFFTSKSGYQSTCNVRNVSEAAQLINTTFSLGLDNGLLIANPIPEEYELFGQEIEKYIQQAVRESLELSIKGRDITPFILSRVNELTEGQSLQANIALVENNARLGAQIAVRLSELERERPNTSDSNSERQSVYGAAARPVLPVGEGERRPTVIGACNLDALLHVQEDPIQFSGHTNDAISKLSCGGVGRNLSDGLSRLGVSSRFLTALGDDLYGEKIISWCSHMDWSLAQKLNDASTAYYSVILDRQGDVVLGVADMNIHERITPEYIMQNEDKISGSSMIIMDGNLSIETIRTAGQLAFTHNIPVFYESTDTDKASKPFKAGVQDNVTFIKSNLNELKEIVYYVTEMIVLLQKVLTRLGTKAVLICCCLDNLTAYTRGIKPKGCDQSSAGFKEYLCSLCRPVSNHIPNILVTLGAGGCVLYMRNSKRRLALYHSSIDHSVTFSEAAIVTKSADELCVHVEAVPVDEIKSVSGAGDCMAVGFIYGHLRGLDVMKSLELGTHGASLSLQSYETVPSTIKGLTDLV